MPMPKRIGSRRNAQAPDEGVLQKRVAKDELEWLDRLPAKLPTLVKRPDSETGVDQCCGIKHDRDREKLPECGVVPDTGGKGIHRNIAERVVEEMADQIGKQHQPTGEADLPDADAADEFCKLLLTVE